MTVQIQRNKQLKFQDIVPRWSDALEKGYSDAGLCIYNAKKCIVGEAHGFLSDNYETHSYGCFECWHYAKHFTYVIRDHFDEKYRVLYKPHFEKLKQGFVDHWNEKHA